MNQPMSVLEMVHGLLSDTDRMLKKQAADESAEKKPPFFAKKDEEKKEGEDEEKKEEKTAAIKHKEMLKIATACDFLSENLQKVVDNRSPTEKLAEHIAIQKALMAKVSGEVYPPTVPGGEIIRREAANASGESLDAGQSGEASGAHQPDKETAPTEHATPADAGNAMDTNKGMMIPEQPEDVLKQAGLVDSVKSIGDKAWKATKSGVKRVGEATGGKATPEHMQQTMKALQEKGMSVGDAHRKAVINEANRPYVRGSTVLGAGALGVGGAAYGAKKAFGSKDKEAKVSADNEKLASGIQKAASQGLIPTSFAKSLIKTALEVSDQEATGEDAHFAAGKTPELQTIPGVPPAQMQGSEAGQNTPRETAPTSGEGSGRSLIETTEAAINYKKRDAKSPVIAALKEVLTEPAMSAAHDRVLQESLTNTSEAGVKIAATRALLKKIAESSPAGAELINAVIKQAEQGDGQMPGAGPAAAAPPVQAGPQQPAMNPGEQEALMAQQAMAPQQEAGVTPEEIAAAIQLLQQSGSGAMPQGAAGMPAPGQTLGAVNPGQVPQAPGQQVPVA